MGSQEQFAEMAYLLHWIELRSSFAVAYDLDNNDELDG